MINFTENNVLFGNITAPSVNIGGTASKSGYKDLSGNVIDDEYEGSIQKPAAFINAIDIDWNGALVNNHTVNSTGDILTVVKDTENTASEALTKANSAISAAETATADVSQLSSNVSTLTGTANYASEVAAIANSNATAALTAAEAASANYNSLADWVKQENKPTYTASEVGALATNATIPASQVSGLAAVATGGRFTDLIDSTTVLLTIANVQYKLVPNVSTIMFDEDDGVYIPEQIRCVAKKVTNGTIETTTSDCSITYNTDLVQTESEYFNVGGSTFPYINIAQNISGDFSQVTFHLYVSNNENGEMAIREEVTNITIPVVHVAEATPIPGEAATVNVGSVTTGEPGSTATVTNRGTENAAIFDFTIPRGEKGEKGDNGTNGIDGTNGKDGIDGTAATVSVGTVTTLSAGSSATVTNAGTTNAAVLNFAIPRGEKGDPFTYEDLTAEQKAELKGNAGNPGRGIDSISSTQTTDGNGNAITRATITYSDNSTASVIDIPNGQKGDSGDNGNDAVYYEIYTSEQAVVKNSDGEPIANKISVQAYKITGSTKSSELLTNTVGTNNMSYEVYYEIEGDGNWHNVRSSHSSNNGLSQEVVFETGFNVLDSAEEKITFRLYRVIANSMFDPTTTTPLAEKIVYVLHEGADGANGTNGVNGTNGTDGVTPTINSSNKHWMIGSTDTGVVAEGQQGQQGNPGNDGNDAVVYKLVPSATIIKVDSATGNYIPSTISCAKKKIVGNGAMQDTSDYTIVLYYDTHTPTLYANTGNPGGTSINILQEAPARNSITFQLINGNDVLDTVTIPVMYDGLNGEDGDSAYQVAVNNGFSGTEVQWLASLKGEKGDPGNNASLSGVNSNVTSNGGNKVTVNVVQTDGVISGVTVSESDIASASTLSHMSTALNQMSTAINNVYGNVSESYNSLAKIETVVKSNIDSIEGTQEELAGEIERATAAETALSNRINAINTSVLPNTIIAQEDGLYQIKDRGVFPVSHPDLSTQPSILPQRFGNLAIKEVLVTLNDAGLFSLPGATIMEAFAFNSSRCVPAEVYVPELTGLANPILFSGNVATSREFVWNGNALTVEYLTQHLKIRVNLGTNNEEGDGTADIHYMSIDNYGFDVYYQSSKIAHINLEDDNKTVTYEWDNTDCAAHTLTDIRLNVNDWKFKGVDDFTPDYILVRYYDGDVNYNY